MGECAKNAFPVVDDFNLSEIFANLDSGIVILHVSLPIGSLPMAVLLGKDVVKCLVPKNELACLRYLWDLESATEARNKLMGKDVTVEKEDEDEVPEEN
ncbi:hypothetical protein GEMRC1_011188 [Eukaryota sp. GEM-RC1]